MNDDSWYLIGLAQGYKKEFHKVFKLLKSLINPSLLYTSFSKNNSICFASEIKQQINFKDVIFILSGKNITSKIISIPD